MIRPEDVPAELVEKAAREITDYLHSKGDWIPPQHWQIARYVLAAVLADIQAQAWAEGYGVGYEDQRYRDTTRPHPENPYAARLTATTEESNP